MTVLLLLAACGLFVWGLLDKKLHVAGWPRVAKAGIVHFTPDSVGVRLASGTEFSAPPWALALLLGVTPGLIRDMTKKLHHRRLAGGLCPACGYDLRATPGRCPECGTEPPPVPSQ